MMMMMANSNMMTLMGSLLLIISTSLLVQENHAFTIPSSLSTQHQQHRVAAVGSRMIRQQQWGATVVLRSTITRDSDTTTTATTTIATEDAVAAAAADAAAERQLEQQQQQQNKWQDDGFVFGLDGSGLARPTGRTSQVVVEGDSLETQPYQVGLVWATLLGHLVIGGASIMEMFTTSSQSLLLFQQQPDIAIVAASCIKLAMVFASSFVLADFGSGVLHWSVDNYGNGRTPIMGSIIAAFQGHHSAPWTITERGFCNNVYKLCMPFGVWTVLALKTVFATNPATTLFLASFCVLEILSQELHKWSHQLKSECPGWVNWLQSVGLAIPRAPHALHHLEPYEGNYCIISGVNNQWLDESGFFRRLERVVYGINGVEPNAWKLDPALRERTLRGDYSFKPPKQKSSSR